MADTNALGRKLRITPDSNVWGHKLDQGPAQFAGGGLGKPVDDARSADVALIVVRSMSDIDDAFSPGVTALSRASAVWLIYQKGKQEVNRDTLRAYVARYAYDTVAIAAVDETWSALRIKPLIG